MKRAFWFVLIATVLLALAGATWLVGGVRSLVAPSSRKPRLTALRTQRQPA